MGTSVARAEAKRREALRRMPSWIQKLFAFGPSGPTETRKTLL